MLQRHPILTQKAFCPQTRTCSQRRHVRSDPRPNRLVEGGGSLEYPVHIRHVAHVPSGYVLVKVRAILEGICHIRHPRHVPVLDVAIQGGGIGLSTEPKVDRILKVCIRKGLQRNWLLQFVKGMYFVWREGTIKKAKVVEHPIKSTTGFIRNDFRP